MTNAERLNFIVRRLKTVSEKIKEGKGLSDADATWLSHACGEPLATVADTAIAFETTPQSLRTAAQEGVFPPSLNGSYNLLNVIKGWIRREKERKKSKATTDELLKRTRNEILELRRDEQKRLLIPVEEVKRSTMRVFNALKMRLLIIPRRVSQPLALETDPIEVETRLQQELFDALKEISKHEFFDEKSEPEKVKADN